MSVEVDELAALAVPPVEARRRPRRRTAAPPRCRPSGRKRTVAVNGTIRSLQILFDLGAVLIDEIAVDAVDRVGVEADAKRRPRAQSPSADQVLAAEGPPLKSLMSKARKLRLLTSTSSLRPSDRERAVLAARHEAAQSRSSRTAARRRDGDAGNQRERRARSADSTQWRHLSRCRLLEGLDADLTGRPTSSEQERCQTSSRNRRNRVLRRTVSRRYQRPVETTVLDSRSRRASRRG